jgi:excisionase family DNA binding protein
MMRAMSAPITVIPTEDPMAKARKPEIPRAETQPVLSVKEAAALLHINEKTAYAAIARDEIPSVRFGKRVLVPTAALRKMLGLDDDEPAAAAS